MLKLIFICAALALPLVAQTQTNEDSVRKLITDFATARNAQDGQALLRTYAEDATYKPFDNPLIEGRNKIAMAWSKPWAGQTARKITGVRFARPDYAVVQVDSTFTGPKGSMHFTEVFEVGMQAGAWQIKLHRSYVRPQIEELEFPKL